MVNFVNPIAILINVAGHGETVKQECNRRGAYGVLHHLSPSLHLFVGLKGVCQCDDGVPN